MTVTNSYSAEEQAAVDRYENVSVDVIIPTYKPGASFKRLLELLHQQTRVPDGIIVYNTEEKYWIKGLESEFPDIALHHISETDFDHGGTRHEAACSSSSDIIIFMTQDAVPAGKHLIENLISPIVKGISKISYARQLPRPEAGLIEKTGREFNYPPESRVKSLSDTENMGIKTFFCSDVCAAYDRAYYLEKGGFPRPVIFNEDMIFAGRTIESGEKVAYTADAEVFHSHNMGFKEQFKRNFDMGVSQADHAYLFDKYPSESEGKKLIRITADRIKEERKYYLFFPLFFSGAFRYAGYRFGKKYKKLPKGLIKRMSSNVQYWNRKERENV